MGSGVTGNGAASRRGIASTEKPARTTSHRDTASAEKPARTTLCLTRHAAYLAPVVALVVALAGCSSADTPTDGDASEPAPETAARIEEAPAKPDPADLRAELDITEDYRPAFDHGEKGTEFQKYIVLHDTEVDASPEAIVDSWDGAGKGVAAHFVVGRDGHIVQCVPLDRIAHHAGNGDTGHNDEYGVTDESRDDQVGRSAPPTPHTTDYGMNSYSIGIELVHVGGEGAYPQAQLDALDGLIAYIDAYYDSESAIIDHKAWRTGNSDTSPEFAEHLASYQEHRVHAEG